MTVHMVTLVILYRLNRIGLNWIERRVESEAKNNNDTMTMKMIMGEDRE